MHLPTSDALLGTTAFITNSTSNVWRAVAFQLASAGVRILVAEGDLDSAVQLIEEIELGGGSAALADETAIVLSREAGESIAIPDVDFLLVTSAGWRPAIMRTP